MRNFKAEGIIIKRINVGESDRILTLFTKNDGKIQMKAKGVRKISSKRSSHIELLNRISCTIYQSKTLPLLLEVESLQHFSAIKNNLSKVGFSYYLCELVDKLCPENQENRLIFTHFLQALEALETSLDEKEIIRTFEISLLTGLGYFPKQYPTKNVNTTNFIEQILERRLKSRQVLPYFE